MARHDPSDDSAASPDDRSRRDRSRGTASSGPDAALPLAPASTEFRVISVAAARELDERAVREFSIPSMVLMENASRELAEVVFSTLDALPDPQRHAGVLIVCGSGNNGGDGLALLRHLDNAGVCAVAAAIAPSRPGSDAAIQRDIARRAALAVIDCPDGDLRPALTRLCPRGGSPSIIVDCLLGTGLSRAPDAPCERAIDAMNQLAAPASPNGTILIAADVPSGLDAQTGTPLGHTVRAAITVTFAALKPGLLTLEAQEYVGEIVVADIGVPRVLLEQLTQVVTLPARGEDD